MLCKQGLSNFITLIFYVLILWNIISCLLFPSWWDALGDKCFLGMLQQFFTTQCHSHSLYIIAKLIFSPLLDLINSNFFLFLWWITFLIFDNRAFALFEKFFGSYFLAYLGFLKIYYSIVFVNLKFNIPDIEGLSPGIFKFLNLCILNQNVFVDLWTCLKVGY